MLGNNRRINKLKDKITLKVNNDIEINCKILLPLIWLELFSNISKCKEFFSIPDSFLKKGLRFLMLWCRDGSVNRVEPSDQGFAQGGDWDNDQHGDQGRQQGVLHGGGTGLVLKKFLCFSMRAYLLLGYPVYLFSTFCTVNRS